MTIGEQLSNARRTRALTQEQVADHLHVARQTISNWEVGRSYPDIASLVVLSDLFQLSLDELVKGDANMVNDLRLKEEERRSARGVFWGSWLVNLILLVFLVLSNLHVPGTGHAPLVGIVLVLVMMINIGVLLGATRRYRKLVPASAAHPRRELTVNLGGALIFAVVTYSIWGFNWGLTGVVSGMIVAGLSRYIYLGRQGHHA
jgi:transcriptional regulator with XRE-family HTH domain